MDDTPSPRYFFPGEVRALRDADRRYYRLRIILLVLYQFAVIIPVRYAIDFVLESQKFSQFHFIKPYILLGLAATVILIWIFGINTAFRRRA